MNNLPKDRDSIRRQGEFRDAQRRCRNILAKLATRPSLERAAAAEETFEQILAVIAETVFRLSHSGHDDEKIKGLASKDGCAFYFWPGYESISLPDEKSRVAWNEKYDDRNIQTGRAFCGSAFATGAHSASECPQCKRVALVAVAFAELLTHHPSDRIRGQEFYPGSTHLWVSSGGVSLVGDDSPLEVLCVRPGPRTEYIKQLGSVLEVGLDECNPADWGRSLSDLLNNQAVVRNVSDGTRESRWPVPTGPSPRDAPAADRVRQILYSVWLSTVFCPGIDSSDWLNSCLDEIAVIDRRGLRSVIERIHRVSALRHDVNLRPDDFNYWYSLSIEPTIPLRSDGRSDSLLGSAMVFSTYAIDDGLLCMIRPWIETIYLTMRSFESSFLSEQQGIESQAYSFAHEMKHLSRALTENWVRPLKELFDIQVADDAGSIAPDLIGRIVVAPGLNTEDMAVVPIRQTVLEAGRMIRYWSSLDLANEGDFDGDSMDFRSFALKSWERARNATVWQILFHHGSSVGSRASIVETGELMTDLTSLLSRQRPAFDGVSPLIQKRDKSTLLLGRLLLAIFKNSVQHGDPMELIRVSLHGDANGVLELKCHNSVWDWGILYPPAKIMTAGFSHTRSEKLSTVLGRQKESKTMTDTERFSTPQVIKACAYRLNGEVLSTGNPPNEVRLTFRLEREPR